LGEVEVEEVEGAVEEVGEYLVLPHT